MTIDFKDLPKVLRACRDARVFRLKAGNLEIEFTSDAVINQVKVNEQTIAPISLTSLEDAKKETDLRANLSAIDDNLDNLHISDPELFEQLQLDKELGPISGQT